jgi:hypothetical protein
MVPDPRVKPIRGGWGFVADVPSPKGQRRQVRRRGYPTAAAASDALHTLVFVTPPVTAAPGRRGRVQAALDRDLAVRQGICAPERAALRVQAHAVDLAEHTGNVRLISTANAVYLQLRRAAGLTGTGSGGPEDEFAAIVSRLSVPGMGDSAT